MAPKIGGQKRPYHIYTDEQARFLLNQNDVCIRTKIDFSAFVVKEFNQRWKTTSSATALSRKLDRLSEQLSKSGSGTVKTQGTECLDLDKISEAEKRVWNRERKKLSLPALGGVSSTKKEGRVHERISQHRLKQHSSSSQKLLDTASMMETVPEALPCSNDRVTDGYVPPGESAYSTSEMNIEKLPRSSNIEKISNSESHGSLTRAPTPATSPDSFTHFPTLVSRVLHRLKSYTTNTAEENRVLENIRREMLRYSDPDNLMHNLVMERVSIENLLVKYQQMVRELVGPFATISPPPFPVEPTLISIDEEWKIIREGIECSVPAGKPSSLLLPESYTEFSEVTKSLLENRMSLESFVEWQKPHFLTVSMQRQVFQAIAVVLLCHFTIGDPLLLFEAQHTEVLAQVYDLISTSVGLPTVRALDMCATKRFIESSHFQHHTVYAASVEVSQTIAGHIKNICGQSVEDGISNHFQPWCEQAIRLKTNLLISSLSYRISFCKPGSSFDDLWMDAENVEGLSIPPRECKGKIVKLCLFPAIISSTAPAILTDSDGDISMVYVTKRRFFKSEDTFDVSKDKVASKAVVLLE